MAHTVNLGAGADVLRPFFAPRRCQNSILLPSSRAEVGAMAVPSLTTATSYSTVGFISKRW